MRIREARLEDVSAIAALSAELGETLRRAGNPVGAVLGEATIRRDAFGRDAVVRILVADAGGEVVGTLLHHPAYEPDLGGRVRAMVDLCVAEECRRRGIGRKLVEEALALARRAEERALVWRVRPANEAAFAFYRSLGAECEADPAFMHLASDARVARRTS